jgi:hypothetical protein
MLRLSTIKFDIVILTVKIIYSILVIIFILNLFIISNIQTQTYLECKFDNDALPCRLIPVGGAPELDVETVVILSDPSDNPMLPLSDITSISK